jgi:AefR-like transcriptional repressor, C-terminal domain
MLAIDPEALDALEPTQGLECMLIAYGTLTLDEGAIAMIRLVLGESDRFPELAATFYEVAVRRTEEAMADWLRRQMQSWPDETGGSRWGRRHAARNDGHGAAARSDAGTARRPTRRGNSRTGENLRPAVPGWLPAWSLKLTIRLSDRLNGNRREGPRGSPVLFSS